MHVNIFGHTAISGNSTAGLGRFPVQARSYNSYQRCPDHKSKEWKQAEESAMRYKKCDRGQKQARVIARSLGL